jgi:lysophospholipase L1-like esterase
MYRFQITATTSLGESIGLVGSTAQFGQWDVTKCLRLRTSGDRYPLWWTEIAIDPNLVNRPKIEYKYICIDQGGQVRWEAGVNNRWIPVESEYPASTLIVDDGYFGQIQPYPYGYFQDPISQELPRQNPHGRKILVIGSSVALGCSAWLLKGWAWHLEQALRQKYGHQLIGRSILGANTATIIDRLPALLAAENPDFAIISLSLGNEGLADCLPQHREAIGQRFEKGLQHLIALTEKSGVRPILGGVYPHGRYTLEHYLILRETWERMLSWGVPVLDWLPSLHDGAGRWRKGISFDAAHPNTRGHQLMFEAIDLSLFQVAPARKLKEQYIDLEQGEAMLTSQLEYSAIANWIAAKSLPILFDDGSLKIFSEKEDVLGVLNESPHEYNLHPMWQEVRAALKQIRAGVYQDIVAPDAPFRTMSIGDNGLESRVKIPAKAVVYFRYRCPLSDIKRVAIVPLGDRCAVRMMLYKMEYDGPAFPFDLTRTTNLGDVADIIANDFSEMWNPSLLLDNFAERRMYHGKWLGLSFAHEVEETDHPWQDMTPVFERMRSRYSARAARFRYTLENCDEMLFIRTGGFSREGVLALMEQLEDKCQGKPFRLLIFSLIPPDEIADLPHVSHYSIEFNPDRMYENSDHWLYCTQVMREILESLGISSRNLFWCPPNVPTS